jgi:hypothetical protein
MTVPLTDCGYAIQQYLYIPTTPTALSFPLGPDDITFSQVDAGKQITIKYQAFNRQLSAFIPEISVSLYAVTVSDLQKITEFAKYDFLNNVRTTGLGSISLYFRGEKLNNLYIRPPIEAPTSVYTNWETPPVEIFDKVDFTLIHPEPKWY